MGLFGLANGIDGDLRTGLPMQMVEVHDPLRLMMIIEQFPNIVLKAIQMNDATYNWFEKNWIHLTVVDPETKQVYLFREDHFEPYYPVKMELNVLEKVSDVLDLVDENLPVYLIN